MTRAGAAKPRRANRPANARRKVPQRAAIANLLWSPVWAMLNRGPARNEGLAPQLAGELLALREVATGTAGARAWQDLDDMARIAIQLARAGIGPELLPLAAAGARLLRSHGEPQSSWQLVGQDLQCIQDLQAAHDAQRRMATEAELIRANWLAARGLALHGRLAKYEP